MSSSFLLGEVFLKETKKQNKKQLINMFGRQNIVLWTHNVTCSAKYLLRGYTDGRNAEVCFGKVS